MILLEKIFPFKFQRRGTPLALARAFSADEKPIRDPSGTFARAYVPPRSKFRISIARYTEESTQKSLLTYSGTPVRRVGRRAEPFKHHVVPERQRGSGRGRNREILINSVFLLRREVDVHDCGRSRVKMRPWMLQRATRRGRPRRAQDNLPSPRRNRGASRYQEYP